MTEKELIDLGKSKVRNNKDLLALFKGFFRESFGRDARCTGCTGFKDFDLLKSKYYPTKNPTRQMQVSRHTVLYPRERILAYLKNGKVYRAKGSSITDNFLEEFLKYGNEKVYPNFRKMVIPLLEKEVEAKAKPAKMPNKDVYSQTDKPKPKPKPTTRKKRSPKKKKDE